MNNVVKKKIKNFLKLFGIEVYKSRHKYASGYVAAKPTVDAALKSGLSVGDYLETVWHQKGNRQIIIDELNKFGIFNKNIKNICEIGTGAGLYAEKTVELCQPVCYESYEPDKDWAEWLTQKYNITSHDADGKSLSYTSNFSVDLVLAHGVFVYLPFLLTYKYFEEIARVTNDGARVVFDILSEECFDDKTVKSWLSSNRYDPSFICKDYVISFFEQHNFSLIGEFFNHQYGPGKSKYLIFLKNPSL
jgi:Methyltransferase domain